jgi:hypothetical protein
LERARRNCFAGLFMSPPAPRLCLSLCLFCLCSFSSTLTGENSKGPVESTTDGQDLKKVSCHWNERGGTVSRVCLCAPPPPRLCLSLCLFCLCSFSSTPTGEKSKAPVESTTDGRDLKRVSCHWNGRGGTVSRVCLCSHPRPRLSPSVCFARVPST